MTDSDLACPCCGNRECDRRGALVSPFIASYVMDAAPAPCEVCSCSECGFVFFASRYTDAEIARLYLGYRGESYLAARRRFEPWYTRKVNADLGGLADVTRRRTVYLETLTPHADSVRTVLDFAGDRGQMMEGGPGKDRFVYDISGVIPNPGVTGITNLRDLDGREFDLVLLCSVLEHWSQPREQLDQVLEHVKPDGLLYVEVPDEQFPILDVPRGSWYQKYLELLAKHPLLLLIADFWSTAIRVKLRRIPPLGFVKQHEHVNFFSERSLHGLLSRPGITVLSCSRTKAHTVAALCSRSAAQADEVTSVVGEVAMDAAR